MTKRKRVARVARTLPRVKIKAQISVAEVADTAQPQWVRAMQVHYQQNGYYRAEDLTRLIGDPRESVAVSFADAVEVASSFSKSA